MEQVIDRALELVGVWGESVGGRGHYGRMVGERCTKWGRGESLRSRGSRKLGWRRGGIDGRKGI